MTRIFHLKNAIFLLKILNFAIVLNNNKKSCTGFNSIISNIDTLKWTIAISVVYTSNFATIYDKLFDISNLQRSFNPVILTYKRIKL